MLRAMEPPPLIPPPLVAQPSLAARVGMRLLRKAVFSLVGLGIICLVGYLASDHKDYPGKAEFEIADGLIDTKAGGIAQGNSKEAKDVAAAFSIQTKAMQAVLFKGGSGRSFASGGEFVTYCRHTPNAVVLMVHVPELRNYKDEKTRAALAALAWTTANLAAKNLPFATEEPTIIVGLRGFASYGPIWSGKLGGKPEIKTDEVDEKRRIYPYFVPTPAAK